MSRSFAASVLDWSARHGRHDLPWQRPATPYRVWVSEIMLQQTQVATVIPYFERFMARFEDVQALAGADEDAVLELWSGLGYYARARNLHRAARVLVHEHGGEFPAELAAVQALPGIGRSTAGAILSLSRNAAHAILDGNVKRVLARHHAIAGAASEAAVIKQLWRIAETHLPDARPGAYNQAMMDLGATVCTRATPRCEACPLRESCQAFALGTPTAFPGKRTNKPLPVREACLLLLRAPGEGLLLERRAGSGRWGGLWSFPEFLDSEAALDWVASNCGATATVQQLSGFRHTFTHFHFDLQPLLVELRETPHGVAEHSARTWYRGGRLPGGVPRPVSRLLQALDAGEFPTTAT